MTAATLTLDIVCQMNSMELCEKYFGTRDLYELLNVTKDAVEKDVKKAYHRLSLVVHPDRVNESEKEEATEKFKVLTKINSVLTDSNKKAMYDEQGIIDDNSETDCDWLNIWRGIFSRFTHTENESFNQNYIGSKKEESDVRKAYLDGKGCLNFMLKSVPFLTVEQEPRINEMVKGWIFKGEVPEYKQFTNEPKAKKNRRHKIYGKTEIADILKKKKKTIQQQKAHTTQNKNWPGHKKKINWIVQMLAFYDLFLCSLKIKL